MRSAPLLLNEAAVSLFPADASGHALADQPLWVGAFAEQLTLAQDLQAIDVTPSGATYPVNRMIPSLHDISFHRLWALRRADLADFSLDPNGNFILVLLWSDIRRDFWYKRTYYGVRSSGIHLESDGVVEFFSDQRFTAQRFVATHGFGAFAPAAVLTETEEQVFFSRAGRLGPGDYLLGHYKWSVPRVGLAAKVISQASTGSGTVATLLVNDVASGYSLTIPSGVGEVTAEIDLSAWSLAANDSIRWVVTSAPPAPADQAMEAAIVMRFERP